MIFDNLRFFSTNLRILAGRTTTPFRAKDLKPGGKPVKVLLLLPIFLLLPIMSISQGKSNSSFNQKEFDQLWLGLKLDGEKLNDEKMIDWNSFWFNYLMRLSDEIDQLIPASFAQSAELPEVNDYKQLNDVEKYIEKKCKAYFLKYGKKGLVYEYYHKFRTWKLEYHKRTETLSNKITQSQCQQILGGATVKTQSTLH